MNRSYESDNLKEVPYLDDEELQVQKTRVAMVQNDRFWSLLLACVVSAIGALNFGFALGYTSPTENEFEEGDELHLSKGEFSWFASIIAFGAIVGSVIGGWFIDRFGRKTTLLLCCLPYAVGWLLIAAAQYPWMLYLGRVIVGAAVGTTSLTVPVYIGEISTPRFRGGLGSMNQLAIVTGIFLAYGIGTALTWRWTAVFALAPVALLCILMTFMPETPRWLLANNQRHVALRNLTWLRGSQYDVEEECFEIESNLDHQESMSISEFNHPSLFKPLIVGVMLMVFQQFSGINAVLFYNAAIFKSAGISDTNMVSIGVALAQVAATGVACLIVDKSGRRLLLLVGGFGMFLCNLTLGFYYEVVILDPNQNATSTHSSFAHSVPLHSISWLSVTSVILFIVLFSIGWGPLPWLIMSEIFPPRAKGIASGITTLSNWVFVFVITKSVPNMQETFKQQGTYWFFSGWCLLSFFFVLFFVPETKGKTLEEIEDHFAGRKSHSDDMD